jgi:hypothetical protein
MAPPRARNANATELTLKALRDLGRLEPVDAAMVGLVRTMADALDQLSLTDPSRIGPIARTQLACLRTLRGQPDEDHADLTELLASMRSSGPMGDPSN